MVIRTIMVRTTIVRILLIILRPGLLLSHRNGLLEAEDASIPLLDPDEVLGCLGLRVLGLGFGVLGLGVRV